MNKKMLGDLGMAEGIKLTSLRFLEAIDYWSELNDIALSKGTRDQRIYFVRVTERILSFENPNSSINDSSTSLTRTLSIYTGSSPIRDTFLN